MVGLNSLIDSLVKRIQYWFFLLLGLQLPIIAQVSDYCTNNHRFTELEYFTEAEIDSTLNTTYGSAVDFQGNMLVLTMDFYYPDLELDPLALRPFLLLVHGGGFQNGSKEGLRPVCQDFAKKGFVTATINYRLGINNTEANAQVEAYYRALQDANAAMRFSIEHAADLRLDTDWIFMGGRSAGAITSLGVAYVDQSDFEETYPDIVSDFGSINNSGNDLDHDFSLRAIWNNWGNTPGEAIEADKMIPMISFHGALDQTVEIGIDENGFYGSEPVHELLTDNNVCSELNVKEDGGHGIYNDSPGNLYRWGRASCFFKSVLCDDCASAMSTSPSLADCSKSFSSIELLEQPNVCVFPNPTLGVINVQFEGQVNYSLNLFDLNGRLIRSASNTNRLETDGLPLGTYLIEVLNTDSGQKNVERIVIGR